MPSREAVQKVSDNDISASGCTARTVRFCQRFGVRDDPHRILALDEYRAARAKADRHAADYATKRVWSEDLSLCDDVITGLAALSLVRGMRQHIAQGGVLPAVPANPDDPGPEACFVPWAENQAAQNAFGRDMLVQAIFHGQFGLVKSILGASLHIDWPFQEDEEDDSEDDDSSDFEWLHAADKLFELSADDLLNALVDASTIMRKCRRSRYSLSRDLEASFEACTDCCINVWKHMLQIAEGGSLGYDLQQDMARLLARAMHRVAIEGGHVITARCMAWCLVDLEEHLRADDVKNIHSMVLQNLEAAVNAGYVDLLDAMGEPVEHEAQVRHVLEPKRLAHFVAEHDWLDKDKLQSLLRLASVKHPYFSMPWQAHAVFEKAHSRSWGSRGVHMEYLQELFAVPPGLSMAPSPAALLANPNTKWHLLVLGPVTKFTKLRNIDAIVALYKRCSWKPTAHRPGRRAAILLRHAVERGLHAASGNTRKQQVKPISSAKSSRNSASASRHLSEKRITSVAHTSGSKSGGAVVRPMKARRKPEQPCPMWDAFPSEQAIARASDDDVSYWGCTARTVRFCRRYGVVEPDQILALNRYRVARLRYKPGGDSRARRGTDTDLALGNETDSCRGAIELVRGMRQFIAAGAQLPTAPRIRDDDPGPEACFSRWVGKDRKGGYSFKLLSISLLEDAIAFGRCDLVKEVVAAAGLLDTAQQPGSHHAEGGGPLELEPGNLCKAMQQEACSIFESRLLYEDMPETSQLGVDFESGCNYAIALYQEVSTRKYKARERRRKREADPVALQCELAHDFACSAKMCTWLGHSIAVGCFLDAAAALLSDVDSARKIEVLRGPCIEAMALGARSNSTHGCSVSAFLRRKYFRDMVAQEALSTRCMEQLMKPGSHDRNTNTVLTFMQFASVQHPYFCFPWHCGAELARTVDNLFLRSSRIAFAELLSVPPGLCATPAPAQLMADPDTDWDALYGYKRTQRDKDVLAQLYRKCAWLPRTHRPGRRAAVLARHAAQQRARSQRAAAQAQSLGAADRPATKRAGAAAHSRSLPPRAGGKRATSRRGTRAAAAAAARPARGRRQAAGRSRSVSVRKATAVKREKAPGSAKQGGGRSVSAARSSGKASSASSSASSSRASSRAGRVAGRRRHK